MKYLLLIHTPDPNSQAPGCDAPTVEEFMAYHKTITDAGVVLESNALDVEHATSVEVRGRGTGGHRRPVRRDPRAGGRLLPDRRARPGRRDRLGGPLPRREQGPDGDPPDLGGIGAAANRHGVRAPAPVEEVFREDRGRLLALLAARLGDLDLAEEVASEAVEAALARWPTTACPTSRWPGC